MRLTQRLSTALIPGVAVVSLVVALYQTRAETSESRNNLQAHALSSAENLAKSVEPLVEQHYYPELQSAIDKFADREGIAGIAVYKVSGELLAETAGLGPLTGSSRDLAPWLKKGAPVRGEFLAGSLKGTARPLHRVALPLRGDTGVIGELEVFHDAAYIHQEAAALWRRALIGVAIQIILIALITLMAVRRGVGRPLVKMTQWLRELRMGAASQAPDLIDRTEFEPLTKEVTRLASSLNAARAAAEEEARLRNTAESRWTTDRLRIFVQNRLRGSRLFVVSNREPYEHFHRPTGIECSVPASGLVTAIEPILRACDGTWIAQATGDADRETVDENDCVRVPPDHPQYTLRRVWLSKEEDQGFYLGFANEGLWPLCHIAHTRPTFRAADWECYRQVNEKFARVVLDEIRNEENPTVLIQDYHFALLPKMIKEKRPDARVAIFWHIPWPNSEAFGICPWQRQLLDGLLGADLIGFHIQAHCNNFLETADRALESRIDWERFAVNREGQHTLVRPFPISVAVKAPDPVAPRSEVSYIERTQLLAKLGVRASFMGIGVDRVDYTKGIPERFRAVEAFLENHPAYRREFTFVQIGSPSRTAIKRYQDLLDEVVQEAERINKRFQTAEWKPIVFLHRQHSHAEIQPYYRTADLCLVTSLHDGMNLVAKEFVAARDDDQGVLVLSRFAGAAHELADALIVNPYDAEEMAAALLQALEMDPEERRVRMQRMRTMVKERNIYRWAGNLMEELCEIRTPAKVPAKPRLVRTFMSGT
jgi:alpha,alpha-trehalose-phosphate synthase [UDP-forming]